MKPHHGGMYYGTPKPCRWCAYFGRWAPVLVGGKETPGVVAVCNRDDYVRHVAQPEQGCAFWMREIGADDDYLDSPRKFHRIASGVGAPMR